ncbi:MAG: hypothetical protein GY791_14320 [Alphaproteobacteria bacterium]|nr:hypothetical protein [Alphaproteobacteria bacterium]
MSTTGIDTWAVDLATIGPLYPFQGTEFFWVILGVVLWLAWHIWQIPFENREFEAEIEKYGDTETVQKAIDDGRSPPA